MSFKFCPDRSAVVYNSCVPKYASTAHFSENAVYPGRLQLLTGRPSLHWPITVDSSAHNHTRHMRARSDDRNSSSRKSQSSKPDQSNFYLKGSNAVNSPPRKSVGGAGPIGARKEGREEFNDLFATDFEPVKGRGSSRSKQTRRNQGQNGALAYGAVGFVDAPWEEDLAGHGPYLVEYRTVISAHQDVEGRSEDSGASWNLDLQHQEPIDTAGMEEDPMSVRSDSDAQVSESEYRQLLRRYVHLREDIQTWSDYFFIQEGRRPQLTDVDATRIQFLCAQFRSYLLARANLAPHTNSHYRHRLFLEARSRFVHLSTSPVDSMCLNRHEEMDDVDVWIDAELRGEKGGGASKKGDTK